jgi:hypothetical protein
MQPVTICICEELQGRAICVIGVLIERKIEFSYDSPLKMLPQLMLLRNSHVAYLHATGEAPAFSEMTQLKTQ